MGAPLSRPISKSKQPKAKRFRLRKLRKNNTDPLLSSQSALSLDKCDSLINIYESKSPSYAYLHQEASYLVLEEGPEDFIRTYKDLKNKVINWSDSSVEWHWLEQKLKSFLQELDACNVWEVKNSLIEKTNRLLATLHDRCTHEEQMQTLTNCERNAACRQDERLSKMYYTFVDYSCRLESIKMRMIEYYGDGKDDEYVAIFNELQQILEELQNINDRGVIRVVVTCEEYQDYIEMLKARFLRLVAINRQQKKTSIFSGGTAKASRVQRGANSISFG